MIQARAAQGKGYQDPYTITLKLKFKKWNYEDADPSKVSQSEFIHLIIHYATHFCDTNIIALKGIRTLITREEGTPQCIIT